jgi:hypothetical protein
MGAQDVRSHGYMSGYEAPLCRVDRGLAIAISTSIAQLLLSVSSTWEVNTGVEVCGKIGFQHSGDEAELLAWLSPKFVGRALSPPILVLSFSLGVTVAHLVRGACFHSSLLQPEA